MGVWVWGWCAGAGAHHVVRQGGAQELVVVGRVGRGAGAVQRAARVRRAAAAVPRHHCGTHSCTATAPFTHISLYNLTKTFAAIARLTFISFFVFFNKFRFPKHMLVNIVCQDKIFLAIFSVDHFRTT